MTEKILDEGTAAFEDTTQDCSVCQTKVVDFEIYNKILSEELGVLAKAKDVISEKTDDSEYRDNRSMLSSSGGLAIELIKSEKSIGLTQLPSRIDFEMHAETSNGDDPFAKVKGLISDMITRLEEKASEDLYLMTSMISPRITQLARGDEHLPFRCRKQHHRLQVRLSCTEFDACSLQPINGASGEHAGLLVSKYQESIGQDLGMKSAHSMNSDSAVMPHIDIKIKWIDDSQGVPLDELKRTRQEVEDVNDVQNIEMFAVRSCKSSDYSGWNGWQSIVIETEYGDVWVDKTDENSQSLKIYNTMHQTTENELEAKDQITEQDNKCARNEGPAVENEKRSVKMRLTKTICWSHAKSEDDAAEKYVSNNAKKALAEATQMLESVLETYEALKTKPQMRKKVHQIKERREVLEKLQ